MAIHQAQFYSVKPSCNLISNIINFCLNFLKQITSGNAHMFRIKEGFKNYEKNKTYGKIN